MKRKILVLGAGGMLGSMLFRYLSEKIDFHTIGTLSKNEGEMIPFLVDFTFRKQIQTIVSQIKPDYIIQTSFILIFFDSLCLRGRPQL